ncbi:LysR substrate-binding domain-containing protein [Pseudomonas frederiksbergensis]|uniref:LysR substrate-binding domain-containing protein n=1 Tax=Pseudomonas frederiksbergensis TaxID=104087 RepID=UPI0022869911|nr:LysR substrate-binding domain-containing protein [Pseudomonas frederiksbergensis]
MAKHNCLRFRLPSGAIAPWEFTSPSEDGHSFTLEPVGNLTTNEDDSMIRVALQNVGLVQHIDIAVREHLESGALVQVLSEWCKSFAGFYIYAPTRAQIPAKVSTLIDFLVKKREALAARRPRS